MIYKYSTVYIATLKYYWWESETYVGLTPSKAISQPGNPGNPKRVIIGLCIKHGVSPMIPFKIS